MDGYDVLALMFIGFAVLDVAAAVILRRGAQRLHYVALWERSRVATISAIGAVILAGLAGARLALGGVPAAVTTVGIIVVLFLVSLPSLYWLVDYFSGRFDG